MNNEYVQQYVVLEKTHWWFLVREKIILSFLKKYVTAAPGRQLQVLNIGASGGASSQLVSFFGHVVSVEKEPVFIDYLRKHHMDVTEASITNLPFNDNYFDLVCAFDVIEHVADDSLAIKEMARVCKPGGAICVTVPAYQMLWSGHDVVNGHYRRYTRKSLDDTFLNLPVLQKTRTLYFNSLLFLPILLARKIANIFSGNRKDRPSDFGYFKTSGILNRLLRFIFGLEVPLLHVIAFPFGVSLISLQRKKDSPSPIIKG